MQLRVFFVLGLLLLLGCPQESKPSGATDEGSTSNATEEGEKEKTESTAETSESEESKDPEEPEESEPSLSHEGEVYGLAFSGDGTVLVSCDERGVRRWNAKTGAMTHEWKAFQPGRLQVDESGDQILFSARTSGGWVRSDVRVKEGKVYRSHFQDGIVSPTLKECLVLDEKTKTLRIMGEGKRVIQTQKGPKVVYRPLIWDHRGQGTAGIAFIPTEGGGGRAETKLICWTPRGKIRFEADRLDKVEAMAFLPDNSAILLLTSLFRRGYLDVFSLKGERERFELPDRYRSLRVGPGGKRLLLGQRGTWALFTYPDLKKERDIKQGDDKISSVCFSPAGDFLAVGTEKGAIRYQKVEDGTDVTPESGE